MNTSMLSFPAREAELLPGFADPVLDAQAVFRAALTATAYPGRVVSLDRAVSAPAPLDPATAALALTLLDIDTPLWLDWTVQQEVTRGWLSFHCSARVVTNPDAARFVITVDARALPRLADFCLGDTEYPDRSTSLIVQVPSLENGPQRIWRGPGIKDRTAARIAGLPDTFWSDWDLNRELYPAGVDVFFTCGNALVSLPRTIEVEA